MKNIASLWTYLSLRRRTYNQIQFRPPLERLRPCSGRLFILRVLAKGGRLCLSCRPFSQACRHARPP